MGCDRICSADNPVAVFPEGFDNLDGFFIQYGMEKPVQPVRGDLDAAFFAEFFPEFFRRDLSAGIKRIKRIRFLREVYGRVCSVFPQLFDGNAKDSADLVVQGESVRHDTAHVKNVKHEIFSCLSWNFLR